MAPELELEQKHLLVGLLGAELKQKRRPRPDSGPCDPASNTVLTRIILEIGGVGAEDDQRRRDFRKNKIWRLFKMSWRLSLSKDTFFLLSEMFLSVLNERRVYPE